MSLDSSTVPAMEGMQVRVDRDPGGVTVRAYMQLFQRIVATLEDVDRRQYPGKMSRLQWAVRETHTVGSTLVADLAPRDVSRRRPANSIDATAAAVVYGVEVLEAAPEIPRYFDETSVLRVADVGATVGHSGVLAIGLTSRDRSVSVGEDVTTHAREAVAEASSAVSSLTGRLDVISSRKGRRRVGLVTDQGRAVICEVAGGLEWPAILGRFDSRVTVSGMLRRNGRGQPVRLDMVNIEPAPERPSEAYDPYQLLGMLKDMPGTTEQAMNELRGRRAG